MNTELIAKLENARKVYGQMTKYLDEINERKKEKSGRIEEEKIKPLTGGQIGGFLAAAVFTCGIALVGIIPYVVYKIVQYKKFKDENAERIPVLDKEIASLEKELAEYSEKNAEAISFLPEEYCFDMALEYMIKLLQTERAQTLPECYDKLEEQIHRWNMEEASAEMLQNQKSMQRDLDDIETSAAIAAEASVISAVSDIFGG